MQATLMTSATAALTTQIEALLAVNQVGEVVRRLGASSDNGAVTFGVWAPSPPDNPLQQLWLELLAAEDELDLSLAEQQATFSKQRIPMTMTGDFGWVVVSGMPLGDRENIGAFYRFIGCDDDGGEAIYPDALAASMPFGAFAPAEAVDTDQIDEQRDDRSYFPGLHTMAGEDGVPRLTAPTNILQIHVGTATGSGTLAALTQRINEVAARIEADEQLDPSDEIWLDYEAVELMPVEPTIEHEGQPGFWVETDRYDDRVGVELHRPRVANWGYDLPIIGGAAVNPSILATGRPHELADLAVALHRFPKPIRLILDLVYGHADNQALGQVPGAWFTGPDMYGQHLDYRNPIVRAHLLEIQRRKANYGADGLRIDGAQDFTWWNVENERLEYDDNYMAEMSHVVQEVAGHRYRPWMIFEDGRPWPRPDWELASSYRAVTERQSHVVQWGPLTFAHNTPFLFTFWVTKWWRLREIADMGASWISGCANHDTLRRGSQVDPGAQINSYLGSTLPDVIEKAYDHPAANLLFHGFLPGIPMDFLQAITRAPWGFIRNTDRQFALKVWGEEARFVDWRITPERFDRHFARLKGLGITDLATLQTLMQELAAAVELHGDDFDPVVARMQTAPIGSRLPIDADWLLAGYQAWMDDIRDLCAVDHYLDALDPTTVDFDRRVRAFRLAHPWLQQNLTVDDRFDYRHPTHGSVLFYGLRTGPDGEQIMLVANMEGAPATVVPTELVGVSAGGWEPALVAPEVEPSAAGSPVHLPDGTGIAFIRSKK